MPELNFEYMQRLKDRERQEGADRLKQIMGEAGLDNDGNPLPNAAPTTTKPMAVTTKPEQSGFFAGIPTGAKESAAGALDLGANVAMIIDAAQNKLADWTGVGRGSAAKSVETALRQASKYVAPTQADLSSQDNFAAYLGRAVGALPITIAEYMSGGKAVGSMIGGMALIDAVRNADKGTWEAIKSGVMGGALGTGLKFTGLLPLWQRVAASGAMFGGAAAVQGGTGAQIAAQGVVGGALGAIGGKGKAEAKPAEAKPAETQPAAAAPEAKPAEPVQPTMEFQQRALAGQERLGLPAPAIRQPDLTPQGPAIPQPDLTPGAGPRSILEQHIQAANEDAAQFLKERAPKRGLEDFILKDEQAQKALGIKKTEAPQAAAKLEAHAQAAGVQPEQIITAAKIAEASGANGAAQKTVPAFRVTPAQAEEILYEAQTSKDPHTLLSLTTDATQARDVRQAAANRLNDLRGIEVSKALNDLSKEELGKIARSGYLPSSITAKAKGMLKADVEAAAKTAAEGQGAVTSPKEPAAVSEEVMKRGREFLKNQGGFARSDLNFLVARAIAGGLYGGTQGDTTEDRIKNALIFAGLGALASPTIIKGIISKARGIDPEAIRANKRIDEGASPFVDETLKFNKEEFANLAKQMKEPGAPVPEGRIGGINFDHINTPADVKVVIGKVAEMFHKQYYEARKINEATGEGISHEQTQLEAIKLANDLGMTEQKLLMWPDGQPMTRPEIQAARMITTASARELSEKIDTYLTTKSDADLSGFVDRLARHATITRTYLAQSSEVARTLESLKIDVTGGEVAFIKHIGDVLQSVDKTGWTPERLAQGLQDLREDFQKNQFVRNMTKPGKADALLDLWYGADLLSNPTTLTVNAATSPMAVAFQVAKRFISGTVTELAGERGNPNRVQPTEALNMVWAIGDSYGAAWKAASEAFTEGKITVGKSGKYATTRQNAFGAKAWGVDPGSDLGLGLDYLGNAIRTFPRAMLATDQFIEVIARRMELAALAAREASTFGNGEKEAMGRLYRDYVVEDKAPPGIKEKADNFASYNTFNSELGSWMDKMLQGIESLRNVPTMGPAYYLFLKGVAPFITISTNVGKWSVTEMGGPLSLLSSKYWQQIKAGGAEAQTARAGLALGSVVLTTGAYLAMNKLITGRGPRDKNERDMMSAELGWQPYSVWTGAGWEDMQRFAPVSIPFMWTADMVESAGHWNQGDYLQATIAAGLVVPHLISNQTMLQGTTQFSDAVLSGDPQKFNKWSANFASSLIPFSGLLRGIRNQMDPYLRDVDGIIDTALSKLPWGSKEFPPETDGMGRPMLSGWGAGGDFVSLFGILNPARYKTAKDNAIVKEILDNRVTAAMHPPSKTIYGTAHGSWSDEPPDATNGYELEPWEYYAYKKYRGDYFFEKAADLIETSRYKEGSPGRDGLKNDMLTTVAKVATEAARVKVVKEFGIQDVIRQKKIERGEALRRGQPQIQAPAP